MTGPLLPVLIVGLLLCCGICLYRIANGPTAAVEVYRFVDSQGRVHLTDRPPHDG